MISVVLNRLKIPFVFLNQEVHLFINNSSKYPVIRYGRTLPSGEIILSDMGMNCLWKVEHPATPNQKTVYFFGSMVTQGIRGGHIHQSAGVIPDKWGAMLLCNCKAAEILAIDYNGEYMASAEIKVVGELLTFLSI